MDTNNNNIPTTPNTPQTNNPNDNQNNNNTAIQRYFINQITNFLEKLNQDKENQKPQR